MTRWITPILLLLSILIGVALLLQRSARRGSFAEAGSTYRAAPDGARALYLLAEAAGLPVTRRHLDLEVIDHTGTIVLLQVRDAEDCAEPEGREGAGQAQEAGQGDAGDAAEGGPEDETGGPEATSESDSEGDDPEAEPAEEEPAAALSTELAKGPSLTPEECRALLDWTAGGGSLLVVTESGGALLGELGVEVRTPDRPVAGQAEAPPKTPEHSPPPVHRFVPGQPTLFTRGVRTVESQGEARLFTDRPDARRLLLEPPAEGSEIHGAPVALALPYGEGWVVAVSLPNLASNRSLARADNARFWLSTLTALNETGTIAFDEHHHGHMAGRTVLSYALAHGLLPAILQLALMVLLAVLAGRRLGKVAPLPDPTLRSSADHLATMANLYRLGAHRTHAARSIARRALACAERHRARPEVASLADEIAGLLARAEIAKPTERMLHTLARLAARLYRTIDQNPDERGKDAA